MFGLNDIGITKSYKEGAKARNNLLHYHDGKFYSKICCLCDRLIGFNKEKSISFLKELNHKKVAKFFHQDMIDWSEITTDETIKNKLKRTYTVPKVLIQKYDLSKFLLSPRSYIVSCDKSGDVKFGCCIECKNAITRMKRKDNDEPKPPEFAISTGLFHGYAPNCLKELNEAELIFISIARVNKHILTYTAGAHKSIQGWHSMNYSSIEQSNRVINYLNQEICDQDQSAINNTDSIGESEIDSDFESDLESQNELSENMDIQQDSTTINMDKINKSITIIMVGAFTPTQLALTKKRATIRPNVVKTAIKWLKQNNEIVQSKIIDETTSEESKNSNIEKIFEVTSVFPDPNLPTRFDGGCERASDFKFKSIQNLYLGKSTLISRSTDTLLRDYEGLNLLKAFPLQFPYGIGGVDLEGDERRGIKYYGYLRDLSNPHFHRAEFVTILHNMFERSKMLNGAFFRLTDQQQFDFAQIKGDELDNAIGNYLEKQKGSGPATLFLQKMKAITTCLSHTEAASKHARQLLFSMITFLGLPSCLFTITPQDDINFRIKIMSMKKEDYNDYSEPPATWDNDDKISEFLIDCSNIRSEFPGLCAIDFDNIIQITIRHFLGWDIKKKENIQNEGLFGDLDGWSFCVEEQGELLFTHDKSICALYEHTSNIDL